MSSTSRSFAAEIRFLIFTLIIYFFVLFPLAQIYFKDNIFLYKNWNFFFYISFLLILFSIRKINLPKIWLSKYDKKHLFLGLVLVIIPSMTVYFFDTLLIKTGMTENDLFSGANLRKPPNLSSVDYLIDGFLNPIASQIFITGYVLNTLINRQSLIVIPGNGILYSLINFDLGLGYLGLGMISAGLLRVTGNLLPSIAFSTGCSLAKLLILSSYPRITTVLTFLV